MTGGRLFLYSHSSWRDGTSSTWEKQSKTGLKGSCAVRLQDDRYTNSTESTMRASRMLYVYFGRFSQISNSSPPATWTIQCKLLTFVTHGDLLWILLVLLIRKRTLELPFGIPAAKLAHTRTRLSVDFNIWGEAESETLTGSAHGFYIHSRP